MKRGQYLGFSFYFLFQEEIKNNDSFEGNGGLRGINSDISQLWVYTNSIPYAQSMIL